MSPDIRVMVEQEAAKIRAEEQGRSARAAATAGAEFSPLGDDRYRFSLPAIGVVFDADRLRRDHNELIGELSVRCELPGARTIGSDASLSIADFNFSSARARSDRAKLLAQRANTGPGVDWAGLVEQFSQKVLEADRTGQPAVDLRTLPRPSADDDMLTVEGLALPRRHPSILFGDGGAGKSYLGLYIAGRLAEQCVSVALFDWELAGDDHRERLERLFPDGMPQILYARCERPLVYEADRLRRIVRDADIDFTVFDSVAFACDGPPEAAEVAGRYFRAARQIGGGSLHVAHVNKSENADQKPFGSSFWHNGARATWYVKQDEASAGSDVLQIGLFNRKSNLGRLRPPLGYSITFGEETTTFRRTDVADTPDLARKLTVRQRMTSLLRKGAMTPEAIAEEIEAEAEIVKRTARRYKNLFVMIPGGHVGLLEKRAL
ncbi:MAG: AAA family ATPase [Bryobacteraceae bacterium]|jgi:hypothetical protein